LEPDHLPQNAPLVVLLQGAHGSATSLIYLWSELHLPPARVACPDGLFFLEGKGFGWYRKESQSNIVQSRDYLLKLVQRLTSDAQAKISYCTGILHYEELGLQQKIRH
jgi:hypothetical protein